MTEDRIEREVLIEAPPERVWELVTEAEHLGRWFGDAGAEVDLRPGGAIELRWAEHGTARARIERIEPGELFSFRWAPFGDSAGAEPIAGNSTLIELRLAAEGEATRLRVTESGFESLEMSGADRERERGRNEGGWDVVLARLSEQAAAAPASGGGAGGAGEASRTAGPRA